MKRKIVCRSWFLAHDFCLYQISPVVKGQGIGSGKYLHIFFHFREHCLGYLKFRKRQGVFDTDDPGICLVNAIAGAQAQLDGGPVNDLCRSQGVELRGLIESFFQNAQTEGIY